MEKFKASPAYATYLTEQKEAKGKKEKDASKKKDKNAPKRGSSAFIIFGNDIRAKIKQENPDASFGEIGKLISEKWKALSDAEKAPYEEKAAKDRLRYEKEMKSYVPPSSSSPKKKAKKATKKQEEEEEDDQDEDDITVE
jgi:hypothetical protein